MYNRLTKKLKYTMSVTVYPMLLAVLVLNFYQAEAKGKAKSRVEELNDPLIRKSPLFCAFKYMSCMQGHRGDDRVASYKPTRKACETRLSRKYMCSEQRMHRKITDEGIPATVQSCFANRRKYFIANPSGSRGLFGTEKAVQDEEFSFSSGEK